MWFKQPLYRFFLAIFLLSTGFGIMVPAVPLYATLHFSLNDWWLGILGALSSAPYILAPAIFGRLSDRVGRRPLIFAGLSLYVVISILYASSSSILEVAVLRVMEGISFSLIWPSAEAFVGDNTSSESRFKILGIYCVSWSAGYTVGPFIMGVLVALTTLASSFVATALFMVSSIIVLSTVKATNAKRRVETVEPDPVDAPGTRLPAIIYTMIVWGFAIQSFYFLFPSYANSNGISPSMIGYLVGLMGLFRTSIFYFNGKLFPALRERMIPAGMLMLALSMFSSWIAPNVYGFILSTSLLGIFLGLSYSYSLCQMLNRPARGLYAGLFESSIGMGELVGPLAMGYLGFIFYPSFPYLSLGIVGLISIIVVLVAGSGIMHRSRRAN
jgi:DHA1 family multidrug resistance protein-like MFS transporter